MSCFLFLEMLWMPQILLHNLYFCHIAFTNWYQQSQKKQFKALIYYDFFYLLIIFVTISIFIIYLVKFIICLNSSTPFGGPLERFPLSIPLSVSKVQTCLDYVDFRFKRYFVDITYIDKLPLVLKSQGWICHLTIILVYINFQICLT